MIFGNKSIGDKIRSLQVKFWKVERHKDKGESMSDWLDDMFEEKNQKEEAKRNAEHLEQQRKAKVQALLPSFWKEILTALDDDLKRYNQRVDSRERLTYQTLDARRFLVEKPTHPAARIIVSFGPKGESLTVKQELNRSFEKLFTISLSDAGDLYLNAPGKGPIENKEISQAVLKDFFRSIQGMD